MEIAIIAAVFVLLLGTLLVSAWAGWTDVSDTLRTWGGIALAALIALISGRRGGGDDG